MKILPEKTWREAQHRHRARLEPRVLAHRARRSRGEKHPVFDFLWEYYSFKPAQLLRWSPGIGVELRGEFGGWKELSPTPDGASLDLEKFPFHRMDGAREILEILENTASRTPNHACFGLHEWAMVYRAPRHRHPAPLRLGDDEIAALVESQPISCSHYDAFRFFTPAARGFNLLNPQGETRAAFEQPGCIHANLDLYKWAYKFSPWIGSDSIADAFEIAWQARWLDMRAAPYDLSAFGVVPICIETAPGRREYAQLQREIAEKAAPVRQNLIAVYRDLLEKLAQTKSAAPMALS